MHISQLQYGTKVCHTHKKQLLHVPYLMHGILTKALLHQHAVSPGEPPKDVPGQDDRTS